MNRKRYIAINLILFAILYLLITFNKEFIRPVYGNTPVLGIITGSFSNFLAAFIISLFPIAPILSRKIQIKKSRYIFYSTAILVFIILTIEEIKPFAGASKTYDINDIVASGLGLITAIFTFELFIKKHLKHNYKN